jgi:hypothetical protein
MHRNLRERDQQVDGENAQFAHGANRSMTASARKTAPHSGIPSYYEFATHRLRRPLTNPSGLASTIGSSVTRAAPTKRRYVRWPSSGSAFFTAAGKRAHPTTNQHISTRCGSAAPPCSNSLIQLRNTLDGLPQGVKQPVAPREGGRSTARRSRHRTPSSAHDSAVCES